MKRYVLAVYLERIQLYCISSGCSLTLNIFKMKNIRLLLAAAVVLFIGLNGCSKGDTGPAGPAGPAGPDSVVYSPWISLNFQYNTNDSAYEDTITAPSITQSILDSGVILTYVNFKETNGTYHVVNVSAMTPYIIEDYSLRKINLLSSADFSTLPYRYVTIPGSLKAGTNAVDQKIKGYTITELKAMPYEQLKQVLSN
jgi:hypothetical protein